VLALIATMTVNGPDRPAFEAVMTELVAAVHANEPGVPVYRLCRAQAEAGLYRMIEVYESQAALDAHMTTPWFTSAAPRFAALFAAPPVLERLDVIA
jgi:quinol monooxygenase YgiN